MHGVVWKRQVTVSLCERGWHKLADKQRNALLILGLRPGPSASRLRELLEGHGWMSQNRTRSWKQQWNMMTETS